MNPVDMGCDLCEEHPTPESTPSGLRRVAPYQTCGKWVLQPKYKRVIPFIFDAVSMASYSKFLNPVLPQWCPERIVRSFASTKFPSEVRWLHCLRINPVDAQQLLNFSVIVLDFMHPTMIHAARRALLKESIEELGIRELPRQGQIYLVPEFSEERDLDLWAALHLMNQEWKESVYDGIVAKQASALYHMQLDDNKATSLRWHLHKFEPRDKYVS